MTTRTITSFVNFKHAFLLPGMEGAHPAGQYRLETDEEQIDGLSFTAYRRVASRLHLDKDPYRPGFAQDLTVEPSDLQQALDMDAQKI